MQKLYKIVATLLTFIVTFNLIQAQVANCCAECQADVKAVSDKQVLLEKITIPKGSVMTNVNTNLYVSYRSGSVQKFWTNLAIATAGIAVSTQLGSSSTPIIAGESRTQSNSVSPAIPLGVSAALIPSIWKNRPRGVPQAGLYVQHRDIQGRLLGTWEQPISKEAKNSAELLTVAIDKPLSEGTLEVYLQDGSKNEVYYWGLQTVKNIALDDFPIAKTVKPNKPIINEDGGCPDGEHIGSDGVSCQPNGPDLNGVTIVAPSGGGGGGPTNGPSSNPWGGSGTGFDPNNPYNIPGGGSNNGPSEQPQQPQEDGPQTKNVGFRRQLLTDRFATLTSYEFGIVTRPNSTSQWSFTSLQCSSIDVAQTSHAFTASGRSNLFVPNYNGSTASVGHNWTLTIQWLQELNLGSDAGVTLLPPSGDYPKYNSYSHVVQ
jgi:hypothetical protein